MGRKRIVIINIIIIITILISIIIIILMIIIIILEVAPHFSNVQFFGILPLVRIINVFPEIPNHLFAQFWPFKTFFNIADRENDSSYLGDQLGFNKKFGRPIFGPQATIFTFPPEIPKNHVSQNQSP